MPVKLLTTKQAAIFLGAGAGWEAALVRLRTDSTRRWDRRGPPYIKLANEDLTTSYYYGKKSLEDWAKHRLMYLTAGDVGSAQATYIRRSISEIRRRVRR